MRKIGIVVVDDHAVVREGIKALVASRPDIEVKGEAEGARGVEDLVARIRPQVVLLDIRLGKADGLALARRLKENGRSDLKVIVLTSYSEPELVRRAMRCGVDGYLLKNTSAEHLLSAIDGVLRGETFVSPEIGAALFGGDSPTPETSLSDEDVRVLELLSEGLSVAEVAAELSYSERTVKRRISAVVESLGAKNRTEAVSSAIRMGLF